MENALKRQVNGLVRFLGKHKESRYFDQDPIIIGGCGRSGTTLLLSILAAHRDIFAIPHETVSLVNWSSAPSDAKPGETSEGPLRLDRLYRYLLLAKVPEENRRWCEKTPRNIHHLENILEYWGEAHFINIIRDPRDVLTSRHRNKPGEYWVSLNRWVKDVKKGLEYQDHPRVLTLRYEDLVQDFEPAVTKLCEFLGLATSPEILNWHSHTTVRKNRSWQGKVVKLHTNSVKKWKLPEHQERLDQIMSDERILKLMKELEYQ